MHVHVHKAWANDRAGWVVKVGKHPPVHACPTLLSLSLEMPLCCSCNRNGSCRSCACVKKANRSCSNCLPSRLHRCHNVQAKATYNDPTYNNLHKPQSIPSPFTVQNELSFFADSISHPSMEAILASVEMTTVKLPPFSPMVDYLFMWSDSVNGETFSHAVTCAYTKTIHWRRNLFTVPSGKVENAFVLAQANLYRAYGAMESIVLRAAMLMPILLLQKPHALDTMEGWGHRCLDERVSHHSKSV